MESSSSINTTTRQKTNRTTGLYSIGNHSLLPEVIQEAPTFLVKAEQNSGDSGFEDCPDLDNPYNLYNAATNPSSNPYNPSIRDYQLHLQQYHAWMYYQQHNHENTTTASAATTTTTDQLVGYSGSS